MLLSKYFLPVLKEQPAEAQIISHCLMLRSGMIRQQAAGIYAWLPLGYRVLKNIEDIVRYYMDRAGAMELLMPCIQPAELWVKSGRFDNYGKEMLKFQDRHDHTLLFGPTNEDMITEIFKNSSQSYRDLPKNLYHIQWKFRDEIRPRFGVMRGREFLMKDAYSFDIDKPAATKSYNQMYSTYLQIFRALGLTVIPVAADNGPIGGQMSHEFHVISTTGESALYYDSALTEVAADLIDNVEKLQSFYAAADEKHDPALCTVPASRLSAARGIEVGHIFYIGTQYSLAMGAFVNNHDGELVPLQMCSYGIGISRLVAAIIEASHDENGIIWSAAVAPFKVSLINLNIQEAQCNSLAQYIYDGLTSIKVDVLYDDTRERPGSKFATHDLIGSPWQIIIGPKKASSGLVEIKKRATGEIIELAAEAAIKYVSDSLNVK